MKVLFLTKYGEMAASTRYRFSQYLPAMKSAGIEGVISPLLDNSYLEERFASGRIRIVFLISALWRRAKAVLCARQFDLVVVYGELFPYLPPFFEAYLRLMGVRFLYDFDDAFFHQYDQHANFFVRKLLGKKIGRIISWSSTVIAGNEYLGAYARKYHKKVEFIPTVIDFNRYRQKSVCARQNDTFTIGWIGSPSTAVYVVERAAMFRSLRATCNFRLVLIGSGPVDLPGIDFEIKPWSDGTEIDELCKFDVGIMPLPDNSWARGKCGFKLIQYMACGLPVVTSPVGANCIIVDHGLNGYLANSDSEWIQALTQLRENPELRAEMGNRGALKVQKHYSLQSVQDKFIETLRN